MIGKISTPLIPLLLLTLAPAIAVAGPTRWDAGISFGYGAFGVGGDFATENHAEGGGLIRAPAHLRFTDWEVEADFMAGFGAADNPSFDDYELATYGAQARRYLTIAHHQERDADVHLEGYLGAAARHVDVGRGADGTQWGYGFGTGVKLRFMAGHKAVRVSMALWIDFERVYTAASDSGVGGSRLQSITFGMTCLGLGR